MSALSIRPASFVALLLAAATTAIAQTGPRATIRITARDSTGTAIPAAEITLSRGLHDVIARGTTNDAGQSTFTVEVKDSSDFQVTLRKIGYPRSDRFFEAGPFDTTKVVVIAAPLKQRLDAVVVTAAPDPKFHSYNLDADDIEKAPMPLYTGWDVVKRLRPDMLTSRGGCETGAREIWVNGKRIRLPLPPSGMAAATALVGIPPRARFTYVPVSVLSEIAPEHIAEIHYHDCFDHSAAVVGNNDAIFVVLKPGVTYQVNVGSFVLEQKP